MARNLVPHRRQRAPTPYARPGSEDPTPNASYQTGRLVGSGQGGTERGGEVACAAKQPGHGDRVAEEAAAKRDLPDAIAISGSLQAALHAPLDVLLRRAQDAGAVRADVRTPDLIVLFKTMLASIHDGSAGAPNPALRDRVFAVIADGLRPPRRTDT